LSKTEKTENWFSRAKTEAAKGIPREDRVFGVVIVVVSILMMLYFVVHQLNATGFFTSEFEILEMIMLYGNLTAWFITGTLEGILGQRLLSRLFDSFGAIIFMAFSFVWLLVVFPFDFNHFADVLPESLRFLLQWITNDIGWALLLIGAILMAVAAVYSPIAYKIVTIKRFKNKQDN
jgi:hypothetical protein